MALVRAKHAEAWVGFNDGNAAWMSRVKELDPTIPVFWDRGKCDLEKDIAFATAHGFETIVPNGKWVTPEVVRTLKAAGFKVGAWTVNDPAAMKRFLDMGVDRLYTDVPQQFLDVKARPNR
jgi:glycerophosphoryl diester phosphodiesterase